MKSKPVQNENESSVSGTKASSKRGSDSVDTCGTRLIKKIRSSTITNKSLCPRTGALRNRLAINRGAHLPSHPNNNQMQCALHMWGNKTRVRAHILCCATCNVHLCVDCFAHFHTIEEVSDLQCKFVNAVTDVHTMEGEEDNEIALL